MTKWLRVCAHCSGGWPPVDFLCNRCWRKLSAYTFKPKSAEVASSHFPVSFLWEWENERLLSDVLHGLKYNFVPSAHRRFSEWMLQREFVNLAVVKPRWVAFPSKDFHKNDHALQLAQAVSIRVGAQLLPIRVISSSKYKSLGRQERLNERKVETQKKVQGRVLFVDDVYTTGTTARQVWRALGEPHHFRAATLAYKRLELSVR